jgi:thiol-disulfide isomerase/thioredoxin
MRKYSILAILLVLASCSNQKPVKTGLEGEPLPSFNLVLKDSTTVFNTQHLENNKPIVLVLFSPYCPYCKAQIKEMTTKIDKLKDIQICLVTDYPIPALKKFSSDYHLDKYPNIIAGVDTSEFSLKYFKAAHIPYTAIYGKSKKLNSAFVGRVFVNQIKSMVEN